ncbi:hypothetical protein K4K54_004306 [Colletotrichum sp. SAR 10_86]|nr:hypothetical protein K4K54_004306 [Colletotrichum sp. SAR 10_86]
MAAELRSELEYRRNFVMQCRVEGFEYVDGTLLFEGIARVDGARLRELCFPDDVEDPDKRRSTIAEARKLFKKKEWFKAQSMFYDLRLTHMKMKTLSGLRYDLCEMVKMGLCDKLAKRADVIDSAFEDAERMRREKESIFLEFSDPTIKAAWDMDLFKEHFFLKDGEPDPNVTPEPIVLHDIDPQLMFEIPSMVEEIDGLYLAPGLLNGKPFAVIGWDREEVKNTGLAENAKFQSGPTSSSKYVPPKKPWQQAMDDHRKYLSESAEAAEARLMAEDILEFTPKEMLLEDAIGSYVVKCPQLQMKYAMYGAVFHLNIQDHPGMEGRDGLLTASMSFGVVSGILLLSFSKDTLIKASNGWAQEFLDEDEHSDVPPLENIEPYIVERPLDRDDHDDAASEQPTGKSRKRSAAALSSKTRRPQTRKKRKPNSRQTFEGCRRLYFLWKGKEKLGEEPVESHGFLDFNATCTGFKGLTWIDTFQVENLECAFQGYKVIPKPPQPPDEDSNLEDTENSDSDSDEIPESFLVNFLLER